MCGAWRPWAGGLQCKRVLALVFLASYQLEPAASQPGSGAGLKPRTDRPPGTVAGLGARCLQSAVRHAEPLDRSGEAKARRVSPVRCPSPLPEE